jgi:hypothetical protein
MSVSFYWGLHNEEFANEESELMQASTRVLSFSGSCETWTLRNERTRRIYNRAINASEVQALYSEVGWTGATIAQVLPSTQTLSVASPSAAFTKCGTSPVLSIGASGAWDSSAVGTPSVINENGTFKMWYVGQNSASIYRIGYVTSTDGKTGSAMAVPGSLAKELQAPSMAEAFYILALLRTARSIKCGIPDAALALPRVSDMRHLATVSLGPGIKAIRFFRQDHLDGMLCKSITPRLPKSMAPTTCTISGIIIPEVTIESAMPRVRMALLGPRIVRTRSSTWIAPTRTVSFRLGSSTMDRHGICGTRESAPLGIGSSTLHRLQEPARRGLVAQPGLSLVAMLRYY